MNAFAWNYLLSFPSLLRSMIKPSASAMKKPATTYAHNAAAEFGVVDNYLLLQYPQLLRVFGRSFTDQFKNRSTGALAEAQVRMRVTMFTLIQVGLQFVQIQVE